MGRSLRYDGVGAFHHVVNRGAARQDIFRSDRDRVEFERLLGIAHERLGVRVHAYALMTNHFHLLLECPDGGLSKAMHLVGSVYVRHHNQRLGRDGPLFRDRFFARSVVSDEYFQRLVRYIHRNPVPITGEAGLTGYRWSSLRAYLGARTEPPWLRTDLVLEMFGGRENVLRSATGSVAALTPPVRAPDDIRAAVDLLLDEFAMGDAAMVDRTVCTLLLDRLNGEVAETLVGDRGERGAAAARNARSRARRRAAHLPELMSVVDEVAALVA